MRKKEFKNLSQVIRENSSSQQLARIAVGAGNTNGNADKRDEGHVVKKKKV